MALACALPETKVRAGLQHLGLTNYMDAVVTAEDSGAPEVSAAQSTLAHALGHATWVALP